MRFEYYNQGIDNVPKLSVDGTVDRSLHFSHWQGNQTPAEVKADTSTEIALKLVTSPNRAQLTEGIELVTNNHFDTDGVLSVWTVLTGERAAELHHQLISAAEAGDFSEFTNEDGVRTSIAIQGSDQASPENETGSPLAASLAHESVDDDARAYELVLPEVEKLLRRPGDYESLWCGPWEQIARAIESFERGASSVTASSDGRVALVNLAPEGFSASGFHPTRHAAPFTAISRYARGELFVIATPVDDGWIYRIDYPYYSWAETVVRPRVPRRDFSAVLADLNQLEQNRAARWQKDSGEMTSAVKFLNAGGQQAPSRLGPEAVAERFAAALASKREAAVGD